MLKNLNKALKTLGAFFQSPFLFLIRLWWGTQFAIAGFAKLINLEATSNYFQSLDIPVPLLNALLAGGIEFIGGILLVLGLFSGLASLSLIFVMIVAFATTESAAFYQLINEFDPTLLFKSAPFLFTYTCIVIFLFGPGKFSLDHYLIKSE